MTCIRMGNAIVCVSPWGRLHVCNKYIWLSFHEYCGPAFYTDSGMSELYEPADENDPVWPEFEKWFEKYQAAKTKRARQTMRAKREAETTTEAA